MLKSSQKIFDWCAALHIFSEIFSFFVIAHEIFECYEKLHDICNIYLSVKKLRKAKYFILRSPRQFDHHMNYVYFTWYNWQ